MPWLKEQLGHILEPFRAFWDHWEAFWSILEHVRAPAGQGGSFTGRFGRMPHIAFWGMSPIAYCVAYAIRDVRDIAGTTRP